MQVRPTKALMPFIKHYLFLESAGNGFKKLRLFSDGNIGMVFSTKQNLVFANQINEPLNYLPACFVYGQISAFKDLYLINDASLVIVVFQPAGIKQLAAVSATELTDAIIPVEDLFGRKGCSLQQQMTEQKSIEAKLAILNRFFTELISVRSLSYHLLVDAAVGFILQNKGGSSITELVRYTGYTERHIERSFMEYIGLSPKKFGNIIRLHGFLKLMKHQTKQHTLTQIAYEAGYADQSHLIKEFKKYTGITPKDYLHHISLLTNNFFEFNNPVSKSCNVGFIQFGGKSIN